MAKPNYSFEKRQRELAKKKKKEEKLKAKAEGRRHAAATIAGEPHIQPPPFVTDAVGELARIRRGRREAFAVVDQYGPLPRRRYLWWSYPRRARQLRGAFAALSRSPRRSCP